MSKTMYKTLEIGENATPAEIKKAYRKLAKQYHPDINKSKQAEEKFKEINAAYEVLGDEKKKAQYDMQGDNMFGGQSFHDFASSQGAGVNLEDILASMFAGGGTSFSGGFGGSPFGGGFAQEVDLDIQARISIPLEDSLKGAKKSITVGGNSFDIKIPQGIRDGQKIRAKGKGKQSNMGTGDLILQIDITNSDDYIQDEDDIVFRFELPLKTAIFGGKVEVHTIYKTYTLTVPKDTKQLQKFRVKNKGLLNRNTSTYGDLYLQANITIPKLENMSKALQDELKKL
ncbi:MAG: J domain-containing protein [Epsilonproteobacteria bacterium]|nr:MAG: J domain-containing protein [Campylobacterota bacterium]